MQRQAPNKYTYRVARHSQISRMHKFCKRTRDAVRDGGKTEGRKTVPEQPWERVYLFPFYILFISIFCPFVCDVCVDVAHFIALLSYPLGCNFKILHTLLASGPRRVKLSSIYISCITFPVLFFRSALLRCRCRCCCCCRHLGIEIAVDLSDCNKLFAKFIGANGVAF